jgi:hypothetical protein
MKPFTLDINLDDTNEVHHFVDTYGTTKGRRLANILGLKGKASSQLATALSNYAWNKATAIRLRKDGIIDRAQMYENICDTIYSKSIQPVCECW